MCDGPAAGESVGGVREREEAASPRAGSEVFGPSCRLLPPLMFPCPQFMEGEGDGTCGLRGGGGA